MNDFCPDGETKEELMPRKKKSKLTRILDAIEKTLADHAKQIVHEDNKKKRVKKEKKADNNRPIDF